MPAISTKSQTATGKEFAPFTLVVRFKKEFQRANPATGEVKEGWTYRSDKEAQDLKKEKGYEFENKCDILGYIYNHDNHKYTQAKLFRNSDNTLLMEARNGQIIFPDKVLEPARHANCIKWLKSFA